ncbi:hypothetical protein ACP3TB_17000 [Rahnella variigena]|uniref:hypothetical protein n=1 Tax=Rahnella variigena TaxID=574964 RepID=UPI003CEE761E
MNTSDWIATASLFIAGISAIFSKRSYSIAKETLRITSQEHGERYTYVKPYLIDSYRWTKDDDTYVSFAIRFTNTASISNSIDNIELRLECLDKYRRMKIVKLRPCVTVSPINLKEHSEIIELPLNLAERSSRAGWITFKLILDSSVKLNIDLYKLVAETADNNTISVETHIINMVSNEKQNLGL